MKRQGYLQMAEQTICRDRQDVHGNPESTHELIAEYWSVYLSAEFGQPVAIDAADVAVMMALFKIARLQVNPKHHDNVIDGIGYLAIAGEIISQSKGSEEVLNEK